MRILLTGMSGVGKSSVVEAMRAIGHAAIDMDEPGWSERDPAGNQLWCEGRLSAAMAQAGDGYLFVSGCAENQVTFYPQFERIILLSAPAEVIRRRLARRTNNPYGKRPAELAAVMDHLRWVEPLLRQSATHEIVTTIPPEQVLARVLEIAGIAA